MCVLFELKRHLEGYRKLLKSARWSVGGARDKAISEQEELMKMRIHLIDALNQINGIIDNLETGLEKTAVDKRQVIPLQRYKYIAKMPLAKTALGVLEQSLKEVMEFVPVELFRRLHKAVNDYRVDLNMQLDTYQYKLLEIRIKENKKAQKLKMNSK